MSNTAPEEDDDLDLGINNNDEPINLVLNSGSPNTSNMASYNSYSAVVTPFYAETSNPSIAEVTEGPSTSQTMPLSARRGTVGSLRTTQMITQVS